MKINIESGNKITIDCTKDEAALLGSLFFAISVADDDIAAEIKEEFAKHIKKSKSEQQGDPHETMSFLQQ